MIWASCYAEKGCVEQQVKGVAITLLTACAGSKAESIFSIIQDEVVDIAIGIQKGKDGRPLLREDIANAIGKSLEKRLYS